MHDCPGMKIRRYVPAGLIGFAGLFGLAGIAMIPAEDAAQVGIFISSLDGVADGQHRIGQLSLPIVDIRLGGRLIIISSRTYDGKRLGLSEIRAQLPGDLFMVSARGATCIDEQSSSRTSG